jgi:hypothetical protein
MPAKGQTNVKPADLRILIKPHKPNFKILSLIILTPTVALTESASRKKSICLQTLKVGANDRSAQELQNEL